jgi:hypothetical protein
MLKPQTVTQQMVRDWLKKVEEVEWEKKGEITQSMYIQNVGNSECKVL